MMSLSSLLSSIVSLLLGVGSALIAYSLFVKRGRRATARRVVAFVGTESIGPVLAAPPRSVFFRLRSSPWMVRVTPSTPRTALLAIITLGLLAGLLAGSAWGFSLATLAAIVLIILASRGQARDRLEGQAPGAVSLLASGLRAGFSVPQAMALVARESPEPTASEFALAVQEIELGATLEEALGRLGQRTSPDYELVSIIASVQHEVGGNLAQALDAVSTTLRDRFELRQQVGALTAQQRLSAAVLTILPLGLFMYTLLTNRSYMDPLLASFLGRLLLLFAGGLLVAGWTFMKSLGQVET
jgi:tight adherence protein B